MNRCVAVAASENVVTFLSSAFLSRAVHGQAVRTRKMEVSGVPIGMSKSKPSHQLRAAVPS